MHAVTVTGTRSRKNRASEGKMESALLTPFQYLSVVNFYKRPENEIKNKISRETTPTCVLGVILY